MRLRRYLFLQQRGVPHRACCGGPVDDLELRARWLALDVNAALHQNGVDGGVDVLREGRIAGFLRLPDIDVAQGAVGLFERDVNQAAGELHIVHPGHDLRVPSASIGTSWVHAYKLMRVSLY
jgi:hypothetical protein